MGEHIEERNGVSWPTLTHSWGAAVFLISSDNICLSWCFIFPRCYFWRSHSVIFPACLCSHQPSAAQGIFVLGKIVDDCAGPWPFPKLCRKGFWRRVGRSDFLSQAAVLPIWEPLLSMNCSGVWDREVRKDTELWLQSSSSQQRPLCGHKEGWMCTSLWVLPGSLTLSEKGFLTALFQIISLYVFVFLTIQQLFFGPVTHDLLWRPEDVHVSSGYPGRVKLDTAFTDRNKETSAPLPVCWMGRGLSQGETQASSWELQRWIVSMAPSSWGLNTGFQFWWVPRVWALLFESEAQHFFCKCLNRQCINLNLGLV